MSELVKKNASELVKLLQSGEITSVELTQAFLDRIAVLNPILNSYLHALGKMMEQQICGPPTFWFVRHDLRADEGRSTEGTLYRSF